MAKIINGRYVQKHDIEANWLKATGFIPLEGELIVYEADETCAYPRFKVGDGATNVNDLPFVESPTQADWNQNDSTAPDYVKNRTHWEEGVILPETELTRGEEATDIAITTPWNVEPEAGKVYTVAYNGVEYACKSVEIDLNGLQGVIMGNFEGLSGANADAPFSLILFYSATVALADAYGVLTPHGSETSVTLSIVEKDAIVHKLAPKFLPDTVVMAEPPVRKQVILPETELTPFEVDGVVVGFIGTPSLTAYPEVGKTYTVTVNGTQHNLVADSQDGVNGFIAPDEAWAVLVVQQEYVEQYDFTVAVEWDSEDIPNTVTLSIECEDTTPKQIIMDKDGNVTWENKTHYEEIKAGLIWEDAAPTLVDADDNSGVSAFFSATTVSHYPIEGKKYTIIHNGVASMHECQYMFADDEAAWVFGNVALMMGTGDTGDKFVIMILDPDVMPIGEDDFTVLIYDLTNVGTGSTAPTTVAMSVEGPYMTTHKIDEKYLPDSALKMTPQSDWNAAKDADGHVLNRTHWIDPEGTVVWDYDYSISAGSVSAFVGAVPSGLSLAPNNTYIVKWGDVEYTCVAKSGTHSTYPCYIGNGSKDHGGEDTGEPFCIATTADGSQIHCRHFSNTPAISHVTVTVGTGGAYHQIDDRFVNFPEVVIAQPDWNAAEGEDGHVLNRTHWLEVPSSDNITTAETTLFSGIMSKYDTRTYIYSTATQLQFVQGCGYYVTWNGTTHKYIATRVTEDGSVTLEFLSMLLPIIVYNPSGQAQFGSSDYTSYVTLYSIFEMEDPYDPTLKICTESDGAVAGILNERYLPEVNNNLQNGCAEGSVRSSAIKDYSTALVGSHSFSFGPEGTRATGGLGFAAGYLATVSGTGGFAHGDCVKANGQWSNATNFNTIADGGFSHAEGYVTQAIGTGSHSEGDGSRANGNGSHAEGTVTQADGANSHAEGYNSRAIGSASHAEGNSVAYGERSHAENVADYMEITLNCVGEDTPCQYTRTDTNAIDLYVGQVITTSIIRIKNVAEKVAYLRDGTQAWTQAEIRQPVTACIVDLADGVITLDQTLGTTSGITAYACCGSAYGVGSHAEGYNTIAYGEYQHAQGKYNVIDINSKYAHIVGNGFAGTAETDADGNTVTVSNRSNAHTIAWDGTGWFAGDVKVGGKGQDDVDAKKLATEEYAASLIPTSEDAVALMIEMGFVDPVVDENGALYTDGNTVFTY